MPVAFTTIPDGDIDPESPITTGLMTSIRDNITACWRTLFVDTAQVGNVGAGTDDLMTYTVPANTLANNGESLIVKAWGPANAAKLTNVTFVFGSTPKTLYTNQNASSWFAEIVLTRRTSALLEVGILIVIAGGTFEAASIVDTFGEDLTTALILKFRGINQTDAVNDAIQQNAMIVSFMP